MIIADIVTTFGVAVLLFLALVVNIARIFQLRDWALIGLSIALLSLFLTYVVFSYNAINGLSNFPYRYWLRSSNAALAVSLTALSLVRFIEFRRAAKYLERMREI